MLQDEYEKYLIGEITHVDVLPDSKGMYEHCFLADDRYSLQTELFVLEPDTAYTIKKLKDIIEEQKGFLQYFNALFSELGQEGSTAIMTYIEKMRTDNERYEKALQELARLGNGDYLGNSEGNMIARRALYE